MLFRGLTQIYTAGTPIVNLPDSFSNFAAGSLAGIPVPVIVTIVVFMLGALILTRTTHGRRIYAIGGNERASYLAGIPVRRYLVAVYVVSGVFSALAGLILTAPSYARRSRPRQFEQVARNFFNMLVRNERIGMMDVTDAVCGTQIDPAELARCSNHQRRIFCLCLVGRERRLDNDLAQSRHCLSTQHEHTDKQRFEGIAK